MASKNKKPGFFSLYFSNFKLMLIGNLLFSVPMIISFALVYGIAFLLKQTDNMLIIGLVMVFVYPFFSGITQITKDVVAGGNKNFSALESYKKGLKNNFKPFVAYGIFIYIAFIVSYYSIVLYFKIAMQNTIFFVPLFISVLIALFLLFVSFSLPILTVTFKLEFKYYLKNAALMAIGELPLNFYIAVTSFVLVSACITFSFLMNNAVLGIAVIILALLLILPTGISYCAVYRLYPKIEDLFELNTEDDFPTTPVTVPTDDEGNPIVPEISSKDKDGYVFVNGMMIKKSQAISTEYINESD